MSFDSKNRIIHSASTDSGSSGSPIILTFMLFPSMYNHFYKKILLHSHIFSILFENSKRLRNSQYNFKICGIHFGGDEKKDRNYACLFTEIINDLKIQVNSLTFNTLINKIENKQFFNN